MPEYIGEKLDLGETRRCGRCHEYKSVLSFGKDKRTSDGLKNRCRACRELERLESLERMTPERREKTLQYMKAWQQGLRDRKPDYTNSLRRSSRYKARHGINDADVQRIKEAAGNKCAICSRTEPAIRLCLDHDHITGEIRGILCDPCNRGIGMLADDPVVLYNAFMYLVSHRRVGEVA